MEEIINNYPNVEDHKKLMKAEMQELKKLEQSRKSMNFQRYEGKRYRSFEQSPIRGAVTLQTMITSNDLTSSQSNLATSNDKVEKLFKMKSYVTTTNEGARKDKMWQNHFPTINLL